MAFRRSLRMLQPWAAMLRPGGLQASLLAEALGPRRPCVLPSLRAAVLPRRNPFPHVRRGVAAEAALAPGPTASALPAVAPPPPPPPPAETPSSAKQRKRRKPRPAPPPPQTAAIAEALPPRQLPAPLLLEDDAHPIRDAHISRQAWSVLTRLRSAGHEAFVVGGTVRDILLRGTPKDFDILTTADAHAVARLFSRAMVVGRRFPVCHVHVDGTIIEVSSFGTDTDAELIPRDSAEHSPSAAGSGGSRGKKKRRRRGGGGGSSSEGSDDAASETDADDALAAAPPQQLLPLASAGPTWASARRDNASKRDFTVNALLYDPFSRTLYDYVGGVADCALRTLRTIAPPAASFAQDPARILRAVRLAARAGLTLEGGTSAAMAAGAGALAGLPQGRLSMEVAAMMGYGSAAPSVELLWQLGLMHALLPHQALLLQKERLPRHGAPRRPVLLLQLLTELDKHAHPQRPVPASAWMAMLAAPLVARECAKAAERRVLSRRRAARHHQKLQQAAAEAKAAAAAAAAAAAVEAQAGEEAGGWSFTGTLRDWMSKVAAAPEPPTQLLAAGDAAASATPSGAQGSSNGQLPLSSASDEEGASAPSASLPNAQYLKEYRKIVDEVMLRMLGPLDSKMQLALAAPRPRSARSAAHKGSDDPAAASFGELWAAAPLPCTLARAAAEQAAEILILEAELRGAELPEEGEELGGISISGSSGGSGGGEAAASQQRRRRGLREEQRLVLQLLRRPEFAWAERTALGLAARK